MSVFPKTGNSKDMAYRQTTILDFGAIKRPKSSKAYGYFMSKEVGRKKWLLPGQPTICKADRPSNLDRSSSMKEVGEEICLEWVRERMKRE